MPQNEGRIYIETVNGVKKGVSLDDIGSAIGSGSRDLGTLCTHENINKWATYKPVKHNSKGVLTETERKSVNYGFTITGQSMSSGTTTALDGFMALYDGIDNSWVYNRPTGGTNNVNGYPYRQLDFVSETDGIGYNHSAKSPANSFSVNDSAKSGSTQNIRISFKLNVPDENGEQLDFSMLTGGGASGGVNLANGFFGVAAICKKGSNTYYYFAMANKQVKEYYTQSGGLITIPSVELSIPTTNIVDSYAGTYKVYPFIATRYQASFTNIGTAVSLGGSTTFYPLPNYAIRTCNVFNTNIAVVCRLFKKDYGTEGGGYVDGTIKFMAKNADGEIDTTFNGSVNNVVIKLRFADKEYSDTMEDKEITHPDFNNVSVPLVLGTFSAAIRFPKSMANYLASEIYSNCAVWVHFIDGSNTITTKYYPFKKSVDNIFVQE